MGVGCCSKELNSQNYLDKLYPRDYRIEAITIFTPQITEEMVQVMVDSFIGNQTQLPEMTWFWIMNYQQLNQSLRKKLLEFYCRWQITYAQSYGVIYVVRDPQQNIGGVILLIPPEEIRKGYSTNHWRNYCTDKKVGKEPEEFQSTEYGKVVSQKCDYVVQQNEDIQEKYMKEPHWFLYNISIKPSLQGKGYGKILLNLVNQLSDNMDVSIYLECTGQKNKALYERFGYKVVYQNQLQLNGDKSQEISYYMIRQRNN